jgi:hypothetical protein
MSTKEEVKAFFEKAIKKYDRGNIVALLKAELNCAGPLLEVIVNGIDCLGGMCYGFSNGNSKKRSINFMIEKMGLNPASAEFLYVAIRCGIAHQGMPKIGVKYFAQYERPESGVIFYSEDDESIYLNVVELAYAFIDVIDKIALNIEAHVSYVPPPENEAKAIFDRALNEITNSANDLAVKIGTSNEMLEPEPRPSSSAYFPDNTFNITKDSP